MMVSGGVLTQIMDEAAMWKEREAALVGTLRYLRTQARNGTLHPQVVIQNVDKALTPVKPVSAPPSAGSESK